MHLPDELKKAIEELVKGKKIPHISKAREELTARYKDREDTVSDFITSEIQRDAYLVARMPATFAVIKNVLKEVSERVPDIKPKTLLDLGAGPGTTPWAASQVFPELEQVTLIEKDKDFVTLGKKLASISSNKTLQKAQWHIQNLEQLNSFPKSDLIVMSYAVGELNPERIPSLIEAGWKATNQFFVVIEPGTPVGFERIRAIRSQLISLGAHMVAPCPHMLACPMSGKNWCHFSERLARSSLHRQIKGGDLGYEDEKYSYVVFSKTPCPLPLNRVLRHPLKRSGHVVLYLCIREFGLKQETISRRNPDLYRQARDLEWGSIFPLDKLYKIGEMQEEQDKGQK